MTDKLTCATCKHFHPDPPPSVPVDLPAHPSNGILLPGGVRGNAVDLSQPRTGQCRERYHLLAFPTGRLPSGQVQLHLDSVFLAKEETSQACGQHCGAGEEAHVMRPDLLAYVATLDPETQESFATLENAHRDAPDTGCEEYQILAGMLDVFVRRAQAWKESPGVTTKEEQ